MPTRRVVPTLGDVAHLLMKEWPSDDGEEYMAAVKACVDAISGRMDPEQFREALLRAACEEGIATLTVVRHGMEQTRLAITTAQLRFVLVALTEHSF